MDVLDGAILLYSVGALLVGLFIFLERFKFLRTRKRMVGPSYWGVYTGSATIDRQDEKRIEVTPVDTEDEAVVGSGMYSRGRAVRSART